MAKARLRASSWIVGVVVAASAVSAVSARAAELGDKDRGKAIYMMTCAICHGEDGSGTRTGPELFYGPGYSDTVKIVTEGKSSDQESQMPAFTGALSEQDIADVAAYVTGVIEGGG